MDRGAWWATVHGVAKSQTRLSTHVIMLVGLSTAHPALTPLSPGAFSTCFVQKHGHEKCVLSTEAF